MQASRTHDKCSGSKLLDFTPNIFFFFRNVMQALLSGARCWEESVKGLLRTAKSSEHRTQLVHDKEDTDSCRLHAHGEATTNAVARRAPGDGTGPGTGAGAGSAVSSFADDDAAFAAAVLLLPLVIRIICLLVGLHAKHVLFYAQHAASRGVRSRRERGVFRNVMRALL